jgi:hypothetical protein
VRGTPLITFTHTIESETPRAFPNPFDRFIHLQGVPFDTAFQLYDSRGQLIWEGQFIEQQDFSFLQPGIYLLHSNTAGIPVLKVLKASLTD